MNEVTKLYENAGVEKKEKGYCDCDYMNCPYPEIDPCSKECPYWIDKGIDYPPFTAEKQLELIKWLAKLFIHIDSRHNQIILSSGGGYVSYTAEKLEDAIALLINSKWNIFTEAEQNEIKRILE